MNWQFATTFDLFTIFLFFCILDFVVVVAWYVPRIQQMQKQKKRKTLQKKTIRTHLKKAMPRHHSSKRDSKHHQKLLVVKTRTPQTHTNVFILPFFVANVMKYAYSIFSKLLFPVVNSSHHSLYIARLSAGNKTQPTLRCWLG
jgi:hypothetical protein